MREILHILQRLTGRPRGLADVHEAGERFGAAAQRDAQLHRLARLRGFWRVENHRPLRLADPERFLGFVRSCGLWVPAHRVAGIERGVVPQSICDRLMFRLFPKERRELERGFSGGGLTWAAGYENLVVNEGLDYLLDVALSGGSQDTTWFVGLLAASPSPLATWTATQIASNDFVAYDEATLPAFTDGGVSGQSLSNTASKASFTISSDGSSIGGGFLIGTDAKGTPAGTLYSAGAFTGGDKSADDNDTLQVTATFTAADDGV